MVTESWMLHTVVVGLTQVNQIKEFGLSPQVEKFFEYGSGTVDPQFAGFNGERPLLRFVTTALKKALSTINVTEGQVISSSVPIDFYWQQVEAGGTRKTGSTGRRWRCSSGIAVISKILGQDGQAVTCEVLVYAVSADGETSPLTIGSGVALPTLAATDQLYTVGPATLGGAEVGGVQSFEFDPRINVQIDRGDGTPFATLAYILRRGDEQQGPSIKITTKHLSKGTATILPVQAGDAIFLRAFKSGGTREALTAAKHIKFAPNGGATTIEDESGRDGESAMLALETFAVKTASLPAFSITTDVAIQSGT